MRGFHSIAPLTFNSSIIAMQSKTVLNSQAIEVECFLAKNLLENTKLCPRGIEFPEEFENEWRHLKSKTGKNSTYVCRYLSK